MELMQETDDISCREELEEEEEITREESSSKNHHQHHHHYNSPPFSSPSLSLSSSPSTTNHHHHQQQQQQQIPWFNMNIHNQNSPESHNSSTGLGLKQLDFMELSLGNNKDDASTSGVDPNASTSSSSSFANQQVEEAIIEKEHMFDKVVTPSDVGKLNRLVIPKQHAEKYFPLDSTTNEKGLLLNFEDRNGKLWRFRYSYWNSSQSYVMTKGWSRFVKEKKLDAGDIVSFQRGVGELYRHRLYIDWRRRSNHHHHHLHQYHDPSSTLFTPFFLPNPNQPPHYSMIRWGATSSATPATTARLYSTSPHTPRHYNYHMYHPFNQQQNHGGIGASGGSGGNHSQYNYNEQLTSSSSAAAAAAAGYYMRSAATSMPIFSDVQRQQQEGRGVGVGGANISLSPMIIDSVPVAHHHNHSHYQHQQQQQYGGNKSGTSNTAAKRLRLFGVNMECGSSTNEDAKANSIPSSSSSLQPHQHEDNLSVSPSTRFGDQREEAASMLFDLDPSLQYRQ